MAGSSSVATVLSVSMRTGASARAGGVMGRGGEGWRGNEGDVILMRLGHAADVEEVVKGHLRLRGRQRRRICWCVYCRLPSCAAVGAGL